MDTYLILAAIIVVVGAYGIFMLVTGTTSFDEVADWLF